MSLISLIIVLIVLALLLYAVSLIPMDGTIKIIVQVIAIVIAALWLLQRSGLA